MMASDTRERQRRRKITLACEPCRAHKRRCDGSKPVCSTCKQRSLGLEQCVYKAGNARTACSDDYTKALHERIRKLERACAMQGVDISAIDVVHGQSSDYLPTHTEAGEQSSPQTHSPSLLTVLDGRVEQQGRTASASPVVPHETGENATGETAMGTVLSDEDFDGSTRRVDDFFGRSSAASFLKEAASSLRQRQELAGSRPLSNSSLQAQTTAVSSPNCTPMAPVLKFAEVDKFALPPRALADHFLQRYWERVFYLYPVFDRFAFEHAYRSLWQSEAERRSASLDSPQFEGLGLGSPGSAADSIVFHCALNAVFALGCCFSDLPIAEKTAAMEVFGNRSKSFVGLSLLDENNISVVQALLIVSLVLQGAPVPNRCWNAVGVACRVAQGLGLHTEASRRPRNEREREIRQRTWYGCVVTDLLVSMTLGRPPMTSSLSILPEALNDNAAGTTSGVDPEKLRLSFYRESVKLSVILEGILQRIYQPWLTRDTTAGSSLASNSPLQIYHNLDTVVEIQGQLDNFEQAVTPFLSWTSPTPVADALPTADRHILAINRNVLHARFIYMQLILHRPILSQLSVPETTQMASRPAAAGQMPLSRDGLRYSFALECGKSCVEAAKRLIMLIHDTCMTDETDVWWWNGLYACTAALVLIVARSCPALWKTLDQGEISALWDQSRSILQQQASFSISARKSLDLLLKVNEHVLLKQAAAGEIGASQQGVISPQNFNDETSTNVQKQLQDHFDMMTQLNPNAPGLLEDTYTMGPLFTWDQNFDFMYASP